MNRYKELPDCNIQRVSRLAVIIKLMDMTGRVLVGMRLIHEMRPSKKELLAAFRVSESL